MRHMRGLWWLAALGLISVPLAAGEVEEIPLVGLDQGGNAVETSLVPSEYVARLSTATDAILSSTVEALGQEKLAAAGKPWKVRTIVVGAGAELEVGVGPIL